jgi:hypothetical protein
LNIHSHFFSNKPEMQFTSLFALLAAAVVTFALPQAKECPAALRLHDSHPHPNLCSLMGYGSSKKTSRKPGKMGY